jgi:hypothetical protein
MSYICEFEPIPLNVKAGMKFWPGGATCTAHPRGHPTKEPSPGGSFYTYLYIEKTILASAGDPTMLPRESKGVEAEEANWHCG